MNRKEIIVNIDGKPIALSRPRFRRIKKGVMCYNAQSEDENKFKFEVSKQISDEDKEFIASLKDKTHYVEINCVFAIKIQSAGSKKSKDEKRAGNILPDTRPDIDNYIKFVLDSIHDVIYDDDKIVTGVSAKKIYADEPYTNIKITYIY